MDPRLIPGPASDVPPLDATPDWEYLERLDALTRVPAPHLFRIVHLSGGRYLIGSEKSFLFCKGDVLHDSSFGIVRAARPLAEAIRFDEAGLLVLFAGRGASPPYAPFLSGAFELDGAEAEEALGLDAAVLRGREREMVLPGRLANLALAMGILVNRASATLKDGDSGTAGRGEPPGSHG